MQVLLKKDKEQFLLNKAFDISYLAPIARYVQWKLEHQWDDYNELFHATQYVEEIQKEEDVWMETHTIQRDDQQIGVLFIVGGAVQKLEPKYTIEREGQSVLLKYFHIIEKGKGLGSCWLNEVIKPYYRERNFKNIYVNSSHPASFPFYQRMGGSLITTYDRKSDNRRFKREGSCFQIRL